MYYDALKTFVTLVEVKNFTKTAEILLMSQPSVSLHIKNWKKSSKPNYSSVLLNF